MSVIKVEYDHNLTKSEIVVPLLSSAAAESGDEHVNDQTDKAQTKVFGIQVPLIMINNTVIDFDAVQYFCLKSTGVTPELSMTVEDKYQIIENIDRPKTDNEVRVQILPKFDNAYKKIDLTFYISNIKINGSLISLTCLYKVPDLIKSRFKSFGEIDTYTLFDTIAKDSKLGFATNIAKLSDTRYMYCDNKSYIDILNSEIQYADSTNHILDYWIDFWDSINLADIKERYNTIDPDEDLQIWIAGQIHEVTIDAEIEPVKMTATLTTHPALANSELFVKNYDIINRPGGSAATGSDKVYSIYENTKSEYLDYLLQNGDITSDIFEKYDYIGENYGAYNYLLSKKIRESYLQKIGLEQIKVTLQSPLLGLMRGHKVNFIRYIDDDKVEHKMTTLEDNDVLDREVDANIPLSEYEITEDGSNGKFRIDKTVSGQYLITSAVFEFKNNEWNYGIMLARPPQQQINILKTE